MTTPAITSTASTYTSVRYYGQFDPYFYTIDNRPLTDLASNDAAAASGADAARRGELISSLGRAVTVLSQYGVSGNLATTSYATGLTPTTGANTVTIGYGALYQALANTASDSGVSIKQAVLRRPQTFSIPAPGTAGQNQFYLLEGQYVDMGGSTSSDFPFWDSTNTLLPSSVFNGELQLKLTAGTAAAAGTEVPPAPSGGTWVQLFLFNIANGATSYTIQQPYLTGATAYYVGASGSALNVPATIASYVPPSWPGLYSIHRGSSLTAIGGSASVVSVGDTPSIAFAHAAGASALLTLPFGTNNNTTTNGSINPAFINPYRPIRYTAYYSAGTAGANTFGVRLKYQTFASGGNVGSASYTSSATDGFTAAGTNNYLLSATGVNGIIPPFALQTAFTGSTLMMNLLVDRLNGDANDTNAGVMNLYYVTLFQ